MEHHIHSVIQNGDTSKVCLYHHQDKRMRGMNGQKCVITLVCAEKSSVPRPITMVDVDLLVQLVAK